MESLTNTPLFGVVISLVAFEIGKYIFNKTKLALFNPLLIVSDLLQPYNC